MTNDLLAASRAIYEIDARTTDPAFADTQIADGDLDGLDLWALLTGRAWPTTAAFLTDTTPADLANPPRAAALTNQHGRLGIYLGYEYCAAPAGREYLIGPYDPAHWARADRTNAIAYTDRRS